MSSPDQTSSPESDWLAPGEAADLARVTVRTLARMADRGAIAFYQLPSGHRRYSRESINRLLAGIQS